MSAYYNEIDPYAAQWLRNLLAAGHIAAGDVDTRSIVDVKPSDLKGYTQCHFFAGIGVWSHALRLAGWPDARPVWTGSCPCQPFSAAGKQGGIADERHLWPEWLRLIRECRPDVVFGEQVEAAIRHGWLDLVQADMEGIGYAVGAVGLPAAGFGAPHIRQRLWFVAESDSRERNGRTVSAGRNECDWQDAGRQEGDGGEAGVLADRARDGWREECADAGRVATGDSPQGRTTGLEPGGSIGELADDEAGRGLERCRGLFDGERTAQRDDADGRSAVGELAHASGEGSQELGRERHESTRPAAASFWSDCDWLPCRDGKARPVEPIAQQMADGSAENLGRLRPEAVSEIEKEVADAFRCEADAREALRDLWCALSQEAPRRWASGRLLGVHEAPILLAFVRQLADQGWAVAKGIPRSSQEGEEALLRSVRISLPVACSSQERGLAGQSAGEHPDAVCVLSSILARHAQAAWGETFRRHAEDAFPLIVGATNRVGRLRAYGNAIVAPVAAEFIAAYMSSAIAREQGENP